MKNLRVFLLTIFTISLILGVNYFFGFSSGAQSAAAQSAGSDSADAIAVRIIPNPNHYSITRWYESQGFQGSPQALIVDGYEAIRDGRTVYVNAANIDPVSTPPTIYTNIYLISYSQDPAPKTVDILGQIVSHWKFNSNLRENTNPAPSCSISALNCAADADCPKDQVCATSGSASSSCQLKSTKNCLVDTDCPTNFFCDSIKSKISRDIKRVGKLEELKEALYNFKKVNNRYPLLAAGTYLPNHSISVWPSWSQVLLSDLVVSQNFLDPINRLGACPGYDKKTCWDETAKKFFSNPTAGYLTLPDYSYAFAYSTDSNGSNYNLCAVLESRELGYHFSPNDPADSSICMTATGVISGGQAGNTPPRLLEKFLTGEAGREFNGYIKVIDDENNPLTWTLDTSGASWTSWKNGQPPILKDTSNPNQKKIYAELAGDPGTYNTILTVDDGQGGVLTISTPITISGAGPLIEAENEEYVLDPILPFKYHFSFSGKNFTAPNIAQNPGINTVVITKISEPSNNVDPSNFSPLDFTGVLTTAGSNKYQVDYNGLIPTSNKFLQDTDFKYRITVTDKYSNASTKDFSLKLIVTNPNLDFNCPDSARIGQNYNCVLGPATQGNHTITYSGNGWPAGLSISGQSLRGRPTTISAGSPISITATNEYGTFSTKNFILKVNSYCGDGQQQLPNSEGRGGIYNDGYEDCDITAGVTSNVASSTIELQYSCRTTDANTPDPILTNTYCVFKSPLDGGGYCGDSYCQTNEVTGLPENCKTCNQDCGNCIATIESDAELEQIAYFNGQRMYKAVSSIGKATRTVLTGDNILAFWMHNNTNTKYGFAHRILIGPTDKPYDVIDTTNSSLRCATTTASHDFGGTPPLSDPGYEPAGELINQGYKWTETGFPETNGFTTSTVLFTNSRLKQINIKTGTTTGTYLPYVWGAKLATSSSTAYYCRLNYNYDLRNLDVCRPRCQDRKCGPDGCGNPNGCGTCAIDWMCVNDQYCCEKSCQDKCVGQGNCTFSGKVEDWMSGDAISGVTITAKNSSNVTVGSTATNSSGNYSLAVVSAAGNYTVTASKTGYSDSFKTFTAKTNQTIDFIMNTPGYDGVRKMLLKWGPLDLDSHLKFGPVANPDLYHVYYGTLPGPIGDAYLDCDDMNTQADDCTGNPDDHSKGQENIRIVSYVLGATYKYYIHDWTHNTNRSACSFAGASITAYDAGNAQLATYTGAASPNKCYWHIFNMDSDGKISPINTYKSDAP